MTVIERVFGVAPIIEKMVENRFWRFEHLEKRLINFVERRIDKMKMSQIAKDKGIIRKTIRAANKKDLEINDLDKSMILYRT